MNTFNIPQTIEANRFAFCLLLSKAKGLFLSAGMEHNVEFPHNVEFLHTVSRALARREPIPSPGFLLAVQTGWEFMTKIRKLPAEQRTEIREISREVGLAMINYNRNPVYQLKCFAQLN